MLLIEQKEAAKQIRGNKEWYADCQWLKGYNKACEDNAQIIEQMKGQEIIYCKNCKFSDWYEASGGNYYYCLESHTLGRTETDFCSRGEADG